QRMRSGCRRWIGLRQSCARLSGRGPAQRSGPDAASAAAAVASYGPAVGWLRTPSSRADALVPWPSRRLCPRPTPRGLVLAAAAPRRPQPPCPASAPCNEGDCLCTEIACYRKQRGVLTLVGSVAEGDRQPHEELKPGGARPKVNNHHAVLAGQAQSLLV